MVDIPRCKYLKIYFCLGEIEMKVQFCTACKDYWNGHKKWIFFCFRTGQNICRHRHNLSVPFCIWRRERKTRVKIGLLYFFSFSQIAPNLKWKKGRPWKFSMHVVVPFLRNLRVAYHKFFISITTTYLHSGKILKKKFCYFCPDSTLSKKIFKIV